MRHSRVIPVQEAKSTLLRLVQRAAAGETVLIGANGHAIAKLTGLGAAAPRRRVGLLKGKLVVPEDFDTPLPGDVISGFEGGR